MDYVVEGSCCSLCGKCRSGRARRAQHDEGWIVQICSRRTCAKTKHLLRTASRISSNTSSLFVEVHHYHHASRPNEDRSDRTRNYSSKLHAESLQKHRAVLPIRSALQVKEPPSVEAFTKLTENFKRQRLH
jgi:hypothetical protein